MLGKRELPILFFLFANSYLYLHADHRQKKNKATQKHIHSSIHS